MFFWRSPSPTLVASVSITLRSPSTKITTRLFEEHPVETRTRRDKKNTTVREKPLRGILAIELVVTVPDALALSIVSRRAAKNAENSDHGSLRRTWSLCDAASA